MKSLVGWILYFIKQNKDDGHIQRSLIEQLPAELILLICSHLSSIDTACLALCCRVLRFKIGTGSLLFTNENSKNREEFLLRISQDIPSYYFCYVCFLLHPWKNVNMPQTTRPRKYTSCMRRSGCDYFVSHMNPNKRKMTTYFFTFVHLQLAMRRYRCGPGYGLSIDSLSHVEVLRPEYGRGATTLMSVEARVCPGQDNINEASLYLRVQQWAKVPSFCLDIASLADMVDMSICPHIFSQRALKKYVPWLELGGNGLNSFQDDIYQCPHCRVDFQCQLQEIEVQIDEKAQVLIITKWLELGDGQNPGSPLWAVHLRSYPKLRLPHRDVGSVRGRFENESGSSQQELTIHNGLLLVSKEKDLRRLRGEWVGRPAC